MNLLRKFCQPPRRDNNSQLAAPHAEGLNIELRQVGVKPMTAAELNRELGTQVATDVLMAEALRRMGPLMSEPSLSERQKTFREQRDAGNEGDFRESGRKA